MVGDFISENENEQVVRENLNKVSIYLSNGIAFVR